MEKDVCRGLYTELFHNSYPSFLEIPTICCSAIRTSCYIFNVFYTCLVWKRNNVPAHNQQQNLFLQIHCTLSTCVHCFVVDCTGACTQCNNIPFAYRPCCSYLPWPCCISMATILIRFPRWTSSQNCQNWSPWHSTVIPLKSLRVTGTMSSLKWPSCRHLTLEVSQRLTGPQQKPGRPWSHPSQKRGNNIPPPKESEDELVSFTVISIFAVCILRWWKMVVEARWCCIVVCSLYSLHLA